MSQTCNGCVHAINPQQYFHACNNPSQLLKYKKLYYADRHPEDDCFVARPASKPRAPAKRASKK